MASLVKKGKYTSRIPYLVQIYGESLNKKYRLFGSSVTIGRSPKSTIAINSITVSRRHCTLTYSIRKWRVKDDESQNGTYVNGRRLEKNQVHDLEMGDIIFLGPPSENPQAFLFDEIIEEKEFITENAKDGSSSVNDSIIIIDNYKESCSASNQPSQKQEGEGKNDKKENTDENIQVEEISLSLLDAESVDVRCQTPFSTGYEISSSGNNSAKVCVSTSFSSDASSQKSDSEILKSKLALLSDENNELKMFNSNLMQECDAMCEKNKLLAEQLAEQQKLKEDMQKYEVVIKNNLKSEIMEKMEENLICNICTEVLIKPTVLDCSHTFCEYCIRVWKKKKAQCPICRNPIKSQTRVLALDHFIDKTLETLTPDQKEKRNQLILERDQIQYTPKQNPTTKRRRRTRRTPYRHQITVTHGSTIPNGSPVVPNIPINFGINVQRLYQNPVVEIIDITSNARMERRPVMSSARTVHVPDILLSSDSDDASAHVFRIS